MAFGLSVLGAVSSAVFVFLLPRAASKVVERFKGPLQLTIVGVHPYGPPLHRLPPEGTSLAPTTGDPCEPQGGVPIVSQSVRLTARGRSERPVIVHRLIPVVLSRAPALDGWYVFPELGGGLDVRLFVADLDAQRQPAYLVSEPKGESTEPTLSYAFTVSLTDVETWELEVFSTDGYVKWGLDVEYELDGKTGVLKIRDDRFEVTTLGDNIRVFTDNGDGTWREVPEWRSDRTDVAIRWRDRLSGRSG